MLFYAYSQHSDSKKLLIISVQLKSLAFGRNIRRQVGVCCTYERLYKYCFCAPIQCAVRSSAVTLAAIARYC